jgi:hypothetical protein
MTIKIHRILKDGLSLVATIDSSLAGMSNSSGMTISHYAYSLKQTEATLPYEIEIVSENVPAITDIDFCVVVRTKVDLTATGINGKIIEDIGEDVGQYSHVNSAPSRTTDLPLGFTEFYKG